MPRIPTSLETSMELKSLSGPGHFQFSGVRPEDLGATEYTLVTILIDITGSVSRFKDGLLESLKATVRGCLKAPRADNLLLRVVVFNSVIGIQELHGFKPLHEIDIDNDYQEFKPDGMTPLYDATDTAIEATLEYAKDLSDQDFDVNGAIYIITDGQENNSRSRLPHHIAERLVKVKQEEYLESLNTILIGLTADGNDTQFLKNFREDVGLTQFVDVGEATPQRLAKLGAFVSKSVSSQSQALGTGGPSQPINF